MSRRSDLVAKSASLALPGGRPAEEDLRCAMCGTTVFRGEVAVPEPLGDKFNQYADLADPHSRSVCVHCAALIEPANLMTTVRSRFLANERGLFRLATLEDIAWFVTHAVARPYVAAINTSQSMHVGWNTPATSEGSAWDVIRVGPLVFGIVRTQLLAAADAAAELTDQINKRRNTKYASILEGLSVYNKTPAGVHLPAALRADILRTGAKAELESLGVIDAAFCNPGNAWAAGALTLYRLQHGARARAPEPPLI